MLGRVMASGKFNINKPRLKGYFRTSSVLRKAYLYYLRSNAGINYLKIYESIGMYLVPILKLVSR